MNRFEILKLPDDYTPHFTLTLTPEEEEMVREEVEIQVTPARRVQFPLFEISSNPVIPLQQVRERRFDLIERRFDLIEMIERSQNIAQPATDTSWDYNTLTS